MEDTIKLPLDADGVPIRPGDVVYYLAGEGEPLRVVAIRLKDPFDNSWRWTIETCKDECSPIDHMSWFLTHTKPDTWEDIEQSIRSLINAGSINVKNLEGAHEGVAPLMERIKRMVGR